MADVLVTVALRSRQKVLTSGEAKVLRTLDSNAMREFRTGALVGYGVTWLATWRLNGILRVSLSGGACFLFGLWGFWRSFELSADNILATDGSPLQKELANMMVNKHSNDPGRIHLLSKHFYAEKVYDDSASDQPKLRWRYKNYFSDNVARGQRTYDIGSYGESHSDCKNSSHKKPLNDAGSDIQNDLGSKKNDLRSKHVPVKPNVDMMDDPLDCVFSQIVAVEEIHHPSTSGLQTGVRTLSHRRTHRRHQMHNHHHLSLDPQHA